MLKRAVCLALLCSVFAVWCPALLLAAGAGRSDGAYWPQWRGPGRDDISAEKGLLQTWPEGGPTLVRAEIPAAAQAPR